MIPNNYKVISYRIDQFFKNHFGTDPEVIIQSPGRFNIIGEHTDYNDGFVLPAAIDHYVFVAVSKNQTGQYRLFSVDYDQQYSFDKSDLERTDSSWINLVKGVISQLSDQIGGVDLAFGGNIPEGAGLSSSAAICCGVAYCLSEVFHLHLDKWEVAKIAQRAEHDYALVQCGIMDQFACMFGLTNHVLLLNCKTLAYEETEVDVTGYKFLLLNSNVEHRLGNSDYNLRKRESAEALEFIQKRLSGIASYQDVSENRMEAMRGSMPEVLWQRACHVVSENHRVIRMNMALKEKDMHTVGQLLAEGHDSLRDHYQVTCEETDFIVSELNQQKNVMGARQVGGGFGGCVLALVKDREVDEMVARMQAKYRRKYGLKLDNIPIHISKGCNRIN